jgi:hypothetical protein
MSRNDDIDIIGLAAAAKALGYDTPSKVIAGLEYIIKDQTAYLNRPSRRGKPLKFNATVEERNKIIALAIVLLESLQ